MECFIWQPLQKSFLDAAKLQVDFVLHALRQWEFAWEIILYTASGQKVWKSILRTSSLQRPFRCLEWRYQVEDWDWDWKILLEWRLDCILGKPKLRGGLVRAEGVWGGLRAVGCSCPASEGDTHRMLPNNSILLVWQQECLHQLCSLSSLKKKSMATIMLATYLVNCFFKSLKYDCWSMATSTTQYHMVQVSVAAFLGQEELLSSGPTTV